MNQAPPWSSLTMTSPLLPHILGPAQLPPSRDVIFSIRPVHAEKILNGSKTVELRRRFTGDVRPGSLAVIYSTSPTSALTGCARIQDVQRLAVPDLWKRHRSGACLHKKEFEDYFSGLDSGYAIVLNSAKPFPRPFSLPELRKRFGFEPPQSYQYMRPKMRALVM
jgi:predicted transcriptional regulator